MTATDIYCQLCGVTSNLGRIRGQADLQPDGWNADGSHPVLYQIDDSCTDCFTTKDSGKSKKKMTKVDVIDLDEGEDEEDDEDEDANDEEYNIGDDSIIDDSYEYMSPAESDDEDNDEDEDSSMVVDSGTDDTDQKLYDTFIEDFMKNDGNIIPYSKDDVDSTTAAAKEHIAGLNCASTHGYNGNHITVDEMKGMHTMQSFVPKNLRWKPANDDEDFELDPTVPVSLSGLYDRLSVPTDLVPKRKDFFPSRHGTKSAVVTNAVWEAEHAKVSAMPFHPACLEVYKRASLKRSGEVDILGLVNWYRLEATRNLFLNKFPRAREVVNARKESWEHHAGDQWLGANPCFVPDLNALIDDVEDEIDSKVKNEDKSPENDANCEGICASMYIELFPNLSTEELADPAKVAAALAALPKDHFRELIMQEMPWLWEVWCDRPMSSWATQTAQGLKLKWAGDLKSRRERLEIMITCLEAKSVLSREEKLALQSMLLEMDEIDAKQHMARQLEARQLPKDGTDWLKIYIQLKTKASSINGLRNRQRIWKDCNFILDRIARHKAAGRMQEGVAVDPAAVHFGLGQTDYSDDDNGQTGGDMEMD